MRKRLPFLLFLLISGSVGVATARSAWHRAEIAFAPAAVSYGTIWLIRLNKDIKYVKAGIEDLYAFYLSSAFIDSKGMDGSDESFSGDLPENYHTLSSAEQRIAMEAAVLARWPDLREQMATFTKTYSCQNEEFLKISKAYQRLLRLRKIAIGTLVAGLAAGVHLALPAISNFVKSKLSNS
ncbi:MAG: hypothetical protein QG604_237 [Candidatus Dependentiae bacterium]|nr:hypothetical protein [Candidatus Dependentiae bacterium]